MGWNPANWAIVDNVQNLVSGGANAAMDYARTGKVNTGGSGILGGKTGNAVQNYAKPGQSSTSSQRPKANAQAPANQPTWQPAPTNVGYGGSGSGGGGGGGGAAYDPADLAYLDDQQSRLERQLGRTDTGLKQALEAILNEYNKSQSGVNKQRGRALEDFGDKREISESGRSRELGKVDTSARMLADSLRQRIGLAGGSGSSAYQIAAPRAVQRQASEQRGDVLEDYSANFQALDKDETRAKEDFASLLEDLAAQRREREGGVRRDITEQRNEIRSNLGSLAGERQKLMGGGYDKIREAMKPYDNQIRQGESLIDSIFNKYTTKYNVKPVQVRDTQLRSYATDQAAVRDNAATGNQSDYAPYKTYLDDEEQIGLA